MAICYVLALLLAIGHLLLFRFIDGKEADGPDRVIPQAYVTTASNILANAFGVSLRGALGVSFCQHLWHLVRASAHKVSTIDDLFSVRGNPFLLMKMTLIRTAPALCMCVVIMLGSQVATAFPPGAITVIASQKSSFKTVAVPSFNASFMGNGSGVAANQFNFMDVYPQDANSITIAGMQLGKANNLITRVARQVLLSDDSLKFPSPCGVNCSYIMEFEGPWVQCTTASNNITASTFDGDTNRGNFNAYTGRWLSPPTARNARTAQTQYNGTYTLARFNTSTYTPISVEYTVPTVGGTGSPNASVILQQDNSTCMPGRAKFVVNNTYTDNVQLVTYTAQPINPLINLAITTHNGGIDVPGVNAEVGPRLGTKPANWSAEAIALFRDSNHMAIVGALVSWISGDFLARLPGYSSLLGNTTLARTLEKPLFWEDKVTTTPQGVSYTVGVNGTGILIDSTRFNAAFGSLSISNPQGLLISVSEDRLNDYLFKMTTSLMLAYGQWNTTSNATILTPTNIYSFSSPLALILPYFITLLVSIPFLLLGSISLIRNGVSAMDGGFIQLVATTTGSPTLDNAAAGGCLGGDESAAPELKELKIRFGELVGRPDMGRVKRAGFGTEDETVPLIKGENYGIARWI